MIVTLAGGVGAARFLQGLVQIIPQNQIIVIGNTGDDRTFYGLHVSPDLDIIMYTLAKYINETQGWGVKNDTYFAMNQLTLYGNENWFLLGDRDIATHIHRTNLLRQGKSLSDVTKNLTEKLGLSITLIPMSDQSVQTHIKTTRGIIHFEEYLVKFKAEDEVLDISYVGSDKATLAPGITAVLQQAEAIILAPSNPLVSIGSILSIPGMKRTLQKVKAKIIAVSPIINGFPVKGPADKLMKGMHMEVSSYGIAQYYKNLIDYLVIDTQDAPLAKKIESLGIKVIITNTIMSDPAAKKALAEIVLRAVNLRV